MHYIFSILYVLCLSINCSNSCLAIDDERLHLERNFSKNIYEFRDRSLFNKVFSHTGIDSKNKSFGVLELIGDKILGFIITDQLSLLNPDQDEGWLSQKLSEMVSNEHNAIIADKLKLWDYIKINPIHKEKKDGIQKILADTCEALIGAIYKDKGIEVTKKFVLENWFPKPENISQKKDLKLSASINGSSKRLEVYRSEHKIPLYPHFKVIQNQPTVCVQVFYGNSAFPGTFEAETKSKAKDLAAHHVLESLQKSNFSELAKNKPKKEILQLFYKHIMGVENFKIDIPQKKENKSNFPLVVSTKHSIKKLEELSQELDKSFPIYTVIAKPGKTGRVIVGGQYGSLEASGSHPQQKAAKEMYYKITNENIALKEAKKALQAVCTQKKLSIPQYVTTIQPGGNFQVRVTISDLVEEGVSSKSLEDAKKVAAKKLYERIRVSR